MWKPAFLLVNKFGEGVIVAYSDYQLPIVFLGYIGISIFDQYSRGENT